MSTVILGMTGLEVYPIAYGAWELGGEWGEFDEQQAIAAIRQARELFEGGAFRRNLEIVSELERFAVDELGTSVAQLAVAWPLANPAVHGAIVGARTPRHIEESVAAAELRVSEGDLERIDRFVAGSVTIAGPFPELGRLSTETSVFTDTNVS